MRIERRKFIGVSLCNKDEEERQSRARKPYLTGTWVQRAGGGGSYDSTGGIGCAGGGGNGGYLAVNATPGEDGKGAGGGGGSCALGGADNAGRAGGHGIVIVRYDITPPPPAKGTVFMCR